MNKLKVSSFNPYTFILIMLILVLFSMGVVLNYYTIQHYKESKVINVNNTSVNKKCTYHTPELSSPQCATIGDDYYVIYPVSDKTLTKGLTYGLLPTIRSDICKTLCSSDIYEIINPGLNYITTKNLDVISDKNPNSTGMIVNISINSDGSINKIMFANQGSKYDIGDTLTIINQDSTQNCTFKLSRLPTQGCSRDNVDYVNCVEMIKPSSSCSNVKPIVNIQIDESTVSFYPAFVTKNDITLENCVLSNFKNLIV